MRSAWLACVLALGLGACGGIKVPLHSGYKGKSQKPWEKAKEIKLGPDFAGKVSTDLDYGSYKRARWFWVRLPGPGDLSIEMEVVPGGTPVESEDDEGEDMDVAIELFDPAFNIIARSDLEAEDAHSLKKTLEKKQLEADRYLVHVYLQGRLDAADVELKVGFARGEAVWKSDFPNQVDFVPQIAAVPVFDDAPQKAPPKPPRNGPRPPRPPTPTPTTPTAPASGQLVQASITDTQADASGNVRIVIGGGTGDGLSDGLTGTVAGVPRSGFKLTGCSASTCKAVVKGNVDDIRNSGAVNIRLK